jgi:D-alanyl-D-alanine dipeptidase
LNVWDCYRPARAVKEFVRWTKDASDTKMKAEFYPNFDKTQSIDVGYLSSRSAHSRGSTVDLGIVPATLAVLPQRASDEPLKPCSAPKDQRFDDGTIDLGTGYDCFDEKARFNHPMISDTARANRALLRDLMVANGFKPLQREWWHFELVDEPFPQEMMDFPIPPHPPTK